MGFWQARLPGIEESSALEKVWEVWEPRNFACDRGWILISGPRDGGERSDHEEGADESCGTAINSGLVLEVEAGGECAPPHRSEWKNVSMEHKEGACE